MDSIQIRRITYNNYDRIVGVESGFNFVVTCDYDISKFKQIFDQELVKQISVKLKGFSLRHFSIDVLLTRGSLDPFLLTFIRGNTVVCLMVDALKCMSVDENLEYSLSEPS